MSILCLRSKVLFWPWRSMVRLLKRTWPVEQSHPFYAKVVCKTDKDDGLDKLGSPIAEREREREKRREKEIEKEIEKESKGNRERRSRREIKWFFFILKWPCSKKRKPSEVPCKEKTCVRIAGKSHDIIALYHIYQLTTLRYDMIKYKVKYKV